MILTATHSVLNYRDRPILEFFLYSGARLPTACRLKVSDFRQEGDEATIRLHEKGDKRRTIGLHFQAAQAIAEYIDKTNLTSGPLFRPRLNSRSQKLANSAMSPWTLWRVVEGYLAQSARRHERRTATGWFHGPAIRLHSPRHPGHDRYPAARRRRGLRAE
jgi:site-specific recombinase XerD